MNILIANDDGIYSPGLLALANVASELGTVHIVAPDVEQSSMGHAITHSRPLTIKRTPLGNFDAHRVNGTPADCVALGADVFKPIDIVLSGINLGTNLGNSIWHSGTLAAAKQAALLGLRGIAFSTPTGGGEPDFAKLAPWVRRVLELVIARDEFKLLNVNLPPEPSDIHWTRQAVTHYDGRIVPGKDPMGRTNYWLSVRTIEELEEGTDRHAVRHGFVSITPLRIDLTDEAMLQVAMRNAGQENK